MQKFPEIDFLKDDSIIDDIVFPTIILFFKRKCSEYSRMIDQSSSS